MSQGKKMPARFKKPPIPQLPMNAERAYRKALQQIVSIVNSQVEELLIPAIPALIASSDLTKPRQDSYVDDLQTIMTNISLNTAQQMPNPATLARTIGLDVSAFNYGQFNKMMTQVFGVSPFQAEPWLQTQLDAFVSGNVQLIRSIPLQELQGINQIVLSSIGSGRSASDISRDITKQFGVAERRANFIARDQVNKLNGQLTQLRQQDVGIEEYIWQTAEDERVRPTHEVNDQKTFRWDDPPDTGHPGFDYNCRCVAIPVIPDFS